MADNNVNVDSRYLKYNTTKEVEELLETVEQSTTATEAEVRSIVSGYIDNQTQTTEE